MIDKYGAGTVSDESVDCVRVVLGVGSFYSFNAGDYWTDDWNIQIVHGSRLLTTVSLPGSRIILGL